MTLSNTQISHRICALVHVQMVSMQRYGAVLDFCALARILHTVAVSSDETVAGVILCDDVDTLVASVHAAEEHIVQALSSLDRTVEACKVLVIADRVDVLIGRMLMALREQSQQGQQRRILSQSLATTHTLKKKVLQERIAARRQRRRWLRTAEGQAYLRKQAIRRQHPHIVDKQTSRTAKLAAELYVDD